MGGGEVTVPGVDGTSGFAAWDRATQAIVSRRLTHLPSAARFDTSNFFALGIRFTFGPRMAQAVVCDKSNAWEQGENLQVATWQSKPGRFANLAKSETFRMQDAKFGGPGKCSLHDLVSGFSFLSMVQNISSLGRERFWDPQA
jgi:hypothetical protein